MLLLQGSVVWGLRPNINSCGDGTWSSSGVIRYIHRAVYGHSFSSSAFLKSVLQVPIDLSARLSA